MEQPRGFQLPGTESSTSLIQILKGVFGLPDAPRAWWENLTGFLTEELEFVHSRMDQAFLVWYYPENEKQSTVRPGTGAPGSVGAILVIHVDDLMIATDGTPRTEALVEQLRERFRQLCPKTN